MAAAYVNDKYAKCPAKAGDTKKGEPIQYDELWSFVDNKGNKQRVWLVLDVDTHNLTCVYMGARVGAAAHKL